MPASIETVLPQQIGKFPVVRRLGVGAMGEVFLCMQPDLDRQVAVKVMRGGTAQWPRFQREARSAARLVHPYVVRVYDVGIDHENPYIVMEFINGRPLSELIGSEYLTLPVTLRLLYHITEALEAAHQQSIIHRDLKPSNILIDGQGRPRLTDFGLAKSLLSDPTLSGSGDLVGTPRYMAPEQILGDNQELDQRVDVFSFGVVMYEMLAGHPPFDGTNVVQILRQVTDDEPVDLKSLYPMLPESVVAICRKAMSKRPEDRFRSASDIGIALREVLLSETLDTADGGLRANEYLNAFVPVPTPGTKSTFANAFSTRQIAAVIAINFAMVVAGGGWWLTNLAIRSTPELARIDDFDYDNHKALLLAEVDRAMHGDLRVPEQKTPRDVLKDSLDEATSLLLRNKQDDDVRFARARLLRRAGECLAADAEYTTVLQHQPDLLAAHVERLLARTQLFGFYLGGWEERLLRYPLRPLIEEDVTILRDSGDATLTYLAVLVERLCEKPGDDLLELIRSSPKEVHDSVSTADIAAFHVELLSRAAEGTETTSSESAETRSTFSLLAEASQKQLSNGLKSDPNHVPLLFLRAASFCRRIVWDDAKGDEDRETAVKRSLPQFEAAMERLRRITLRQGCDTHIARAVLLTNMGWSSSASDQQLQDALSCRPTIPQLHAVRTWIRLRSPEDGTHTADSLTRLVGEFDEKHVDEPEERTGYFVRAVLYAGLGRFSEIRRPLRICRSKFAKADGWFALDEVHQRWIDASDENDTSLLFATRPILSQLPISPDVARQLHVELLDRLEDNEIVASENLSESVIRDYRAETHLSYAEILASLDDRDQTLEHVRKSLEQRSPAVTAEMCRDNSALSQWDDDEEFQILYAGFIPAEKTDTFPAASTPSVSEPNDATSKPE